MYVSINFFWKETVENYFLGDKLSDKHAICIQYMKKTYVFNINVFSILLIQDFNKNITKNESQEEFLLQEIQFLCIV